MIKYPLTPIKPAHHDLHYALLTKVQLANELWAGSNNLIQGRLENAKAHAAAIDGQVVAGVNAALGSAFAVTKDVAKKLHDAINKGIDSALRKTGTLEHRATAQSSVRGEALPPALIGPDLEAALQIEQLPQDSPNAEQVAEITWIEIPFDGES